jgi:hypothetical protein
VEGFREVPYLHLDCCMTDILYWQCGCIDRTKNLHMIRQFHFYLVLILDNSHRKARTPIQSLYLCFKQVLILWVSYLRYCYRSLYLGPPTHFYRTLHTSSLTSSCTHQQQIGQIQEVYTSTTHIHSNTVFAVIYFFTLSKVPSDIDSNQSYNLKGGYKVIWCLIAEFISH